MTINTYVNMFVYFTWFEPVITVPMSITEPSSLLHEWPTNATDDKV
jgi:hypothetical protein